MPKPAIFLHTYMFVKHTVQHVSKKIEKIYVRRFIWLTRVVLSIIFNKGHMYHFVWTEGQKKKKLLVHIIIFSKLPSFLFEK